ncbi:ATP-binding cassette domain-containing protein [Enterococcus hirae]|uniref:ATP-binding cassette domain-containing protein n=1 Tax=Enterococcus hirae TaxID=1354 RepID=UPI0023DA62F9|nr:ATP-binding cassette domain-containing protein [Enterococcus hirae]
MIYLNNVSKKYKDLDILLHANYRFKDGTLTCVLGNSGAGKSTLLNLIAGLDIDYDGEIENLCFKEKISQIKTCLIIDSTMWDLFFKIIIS